MSKRWERQSANPGVLVDRAYGIVVDWGTTVPADATVGFAPGALYVDINAAAGSQLWINEGTFASAAFKGMASVASGTFTTLTATTLVTNTWTASAAATTITVKANTAAALAVTDATTSIINVDSRNTVTAVAAVGITASPPTITAASGVTYSQFKVNALTATLTGSTGVTALDGIGVYVGAPTVTDASAVTVTTISNLYVALPVASGSVTGTNIFTANFAGAIRVDGNIVVSNQATTVTVKANTAATFVVSDGTTSIISVDSRNTVTGVVGVTISASAPTIAGASGSTFSQMAVAAKTITTSTATTITALDGLGLKIGAQTIAQSGGAVVVTTASGLYVSKVVAGSSVTITNNYLINTDQSGCFCTAGGVWTDTASWAWGKRAIEDATKGAVFGILDKLNARSWIYRNDVHGDDFGRERVGIVYDELPDQLRAPGQEKWVAAGVLASFALAALKVLKGENDELRERLARLEAKLA